MEVKVTMRENPFLIVETVMMEENLNSMLTSTRPVTVVVVEVKDDEDDHQQMEFLVRV